jgi:hypothetical protein
MAQVRHLALDGSRHEIEADLDLRRPFTSVADLDVGGRRHELTAGPLTLGDEVAAALGIGGFTEELSYSGGTLRIATGTVTDPRTGVGDKVTVAAWQGRAYSLVASLYNATTPDVLRILGAVRIVEHDAGIALAPAGSGAVLGRVLVLKEVPGLGLLEISGRTRDAVRELPDWAGLALPSGELFQDTLSNGRPYFLLSTPSATVTVLPLAGGATGALGAGDADAVNASAVAGLLGSLRVSVRPPAGTL